MLTHRSPARPHAALARLLACVAGLAMSSATLAQSEMAPPPARGLGGPEVTEQRGPKGEGDFGGGGPEFRRGKEGGQRGMAMVYREALSVVLKDDAPDNIRASDAQREQLTTIMREHGEQVRAYMDQHKDELAQLRGKGADADEDARRANRQKAEEIMRGAPNAKDAYNRAWQLLTPAQQAAVTERLSQVEARMSERRQDEYVRRRVGPDAGRERGPQADGPRRRGPDAGPGDGRPGDGPRSGPDGDRRERLMKIFERMSPEQQEQLLRRLEERMAGRGDGERRERRAGPRNRDEARTPPADMPPATE